MEKSLIKQKVFNLIKICLFISLGVLIFGSAQQILSKSWNYPNFTENHTAGLKTFYEQDNDIDQVLFLGTSHTEYGVSPMEIYEDSGIVSYNLATSGQPIEVTYHLLKSAFETQSPNVVVLDVSSLFFNDTLNTAGWRYVLDGMPFGKTKIEMAREYSMYANDTDEFDLSCEKDFINALVPMFQYHTRWDELTEMDFDDVWSNNSYATAGYFLSTYRNGSLSIDEMNSIAETLDEQNTYYRTICDDEECEYYGDDDSLYSVDITNRKKKYLSFIKELCEKNESVLVLAKFPTINNPITYSSSWTIQRSEATKELAEDEGIQFLDFVYDIDCGFDNTADFQDGGAHCNYLGAKKVSLWLSNYLQTFFGLQSKENAEFDKNKEIYDKLTEVAEIQLSRDCSEIMDYIVENKEKYIVCISTSDDMVSGLDDEEIYALEALGLKTDFRNAMSYSDSYVAIVNQGKVEIERASNRKIKYNTTLSNVDGDEININILSSGYYTSSDSQIEVNGEDYSLGGRGINIVLIDAETHEVVVSKTIDTYQPVGEHAVSSGDDLIMLYEYWEEQLK